MNDVIDGQVQCAECGAIRVCGARGLAVCPNGHGKLVPNWRPEEFPMAETAGFVRLGIGHGGARRRQRAYHVVGDHRVYRLAAANVDGRIPEPDECLAFVVYGTSNDCVARGRVRLLKPIEDAAAKTRKA